MKEIIQKVFYILVIISLVLSVYLIYNSNKSKGEWQCIARQCTRESTNDEWVKQNCALKENEMICDFTINDVPYNLPLNQLNVSSLKSCQEWKCAAEVLVRKNI